MVKRVSNLTSNITQKNNTRSLKNSPWLDYREEEDWQKLKRIVIKKKKGARKVVFLDEYRIGGNITGESDVIVRAK